MIFMCRKNILFVIILSLLFVQTSFSKDNITNPNDLIYIPINRRDLNKFDFSKEIKVLPSRVKEALNVN